MKMTHQQEFKSSDLYLAAYLIKLGEKLIGIDKSNRKRAVFIFEHTPQIDSLTELYWSKETMVEPRDYIAVVKDLKDSLYAV